MIGYTSDATLGCLLETEEFVDYLLDDFAAARGIQAYAGHAVYCARLLQLVAGDCARGHLQLEVQALEVAPCRAQRLVHALLLDREAFLERLHEFEIREALETLLRQDQRGT